MAFHTSDWSVENDVADAGVLNRVAIARSGATRAEHNERRSVIILLPNSEGPTTKLMGAAGKSVQWSSGEIADERPSNVSGKAAPPKPVPLS
jgi:hypothetical protein